MCEEHLITDDATSAEAKRLHGGNTSSSASSATLSASRLRGARAKLLLIWLAFGALCASVLLNFGMWDSEQTRISQIHILQEQVANLGARLTAQENATREPLAVFPQLVGVVNLHSQLMQTNGWMK